MTTEVKSSPYLTVHCHHDSKHGFEYKFVFYEHAYASTAMPRHKKRPYRILTPF